MTTTTKLAAKLFQGSRLSVQEVRKLRAASGFTLVRQKGSHEQWVKRGATFTLACHGKAIPHYILDALKKLI